MHTTAIIPYREPGQIEKHEVRKIGLIPARPQAPEHKCNLPLTYTTTKKEKTFWWFTKITTTEHKVLPGSLYRCPGCLKVYLFDKYINPNYSYTTVWEQPGWHSSKRANQLWFEKTGELVDGESEHLDLTTP